MQIQWKSIGGRDLKAEFNCSCPDKKYKDDKILAEILKTKISLSGYNDRYFWDTVNKEPGEFDCECSKRYTHQWMEDGYVEINEIK